ncbi:MAG TPA: peptidase [Candidatus Lokiarchaeia archaeon]|nr:peptidase [Candidatus Lokiarchaeia archaeon]
MKDYIGKSLADLENELVKLIKEYNAIKNAYLIVYAGTLNKPDLPTFMDMEDFYVISDLLRDIYVENLDFYIETPGGIAEAAEEIARFLHSHFGIVTFVISGEAKSAGTILILSGDEIMMTESGSLGPIDAQLKIGRIPISAIDYIEWVEEKRKDAEKKGKLNPFDAMTIAQISPGELKRVFNALQYAKDLVVDWLPKYKFKNWTITETREIPVSEEMKRERAIELSELLTDREKWRSHGRSIKIDDLANYLKITKIDDDPKLSEIVYRIQTVIRFIFGVSNNYKVFATADEKLFKTAFSQQNPIQNPNLKPDVVEIDIDCPHCGKKHNIYAKFLPNPQIDIDLKKKGRTPFPKNNILRCSCGFEIDLSGLKNDLESKMKNRIIV